MPIFGLSLHGVPLSDEDLDFIVQACPELHYLWLRHPSSMSQDEFEDLTDDERAVIATQTLSGEHLAKIGELKNLTALEIGGYALPPTRLRFLETLKVGLRILDLRDTKITDEDLRSLGRLEDLNLLNLSGTPVTGRGLRYLHNCHSLEHVILDRTKANDELAKYVADNPLPSLYQLGIHGCTKLTRRTAGLPYRTPFLFFTVVDTDEFGYGTLKPPEPKQAAQAIRLYRAACSLVMNLDLRRSEPTEKHVQGIDLVSDRHWSEAWTSSIVARVEGLNSLRPMTVAI